MRFPKGVLVVDLETTGVSPSHAQIIEIGVVYVTPRGEIGEPRAHVTCPPLPIPDDAHTQRALEVNGITRAEIAAAPPLLHVLGELHGWWQRIGAPPLLAYPNHFEAGFLRAAGFAFPWEACLMRVSQKLMGRQPKLIDVADALALDYDAATLHRAGPDAHLEARVFLALVNQNRWPSR